MKEFKSLTKNTVLVFCFGEKKQVHFDINAVIFDSMFSNTDWLYAVKTKRQEFQTESLRVIFIDVQIENDMGLK